MKQENELLPGYFRYVGATISIICFLYALVHHFIQPNLFFEGLRNPNLFFCFGLILIILSKQNIEDEYAKQVRLYAHSMISVFFIMFIFMDELKGEKYSFLSELTGFLLMYLLIFYYSFKKGTDWIENPTFKVQFVWVILFLSVIIIQNFLWAS